MIASGVEYSSLFTSNHDWAWLADTGPVDRGYAPTYSTTVDGALRSGYTRLHRVKARNR